MKIRWMLRTLGLFCLTLVAIACTQFSQVPTSSEAEGTPTRGDFEVAVLLPGPKDDGSWSEMGYRGAQLIEKELMLPITLVDNIPNGEFAGHLRKVAQQGADFVIGFGGEFSDDAITVADEFPRTKFAVVNGNNSNNRNLGTITIKAEESGYLAGVIAAIKSQTQKVAYVGGVSYPHVKRQAQQFIQGAQSINPQIVAKTVFTESWTEAAKGEAIGKNILSEKFDTIVVNADLAGLPIHALAQKAGAKTIGWVVDQNNLAPDTVVTSMIENFSIALLSAAKLAQTGRWEGKQYKFGLLEGVNSIAPFYDLLTPAQIAQIEQIKDDLMSGKIVLTAVSS
jgi:basic membrane protein A and related proteins